MRRLLAALGAGAAALFLARAAARRPPPGETVGTIAEFAEAEALTRAVLAARGAGWKHFEAYAPHPVPEAAEVIGAKAAPVGWIAAGVGLAAAAAAYGFTLYVSVIDYPLNVGGRPPHAWPVFLPAAYIVGVLWAALAAMLAMLWLNGLPRLHHPVFAAPGFGRASEDRFFLLLFREDPLHTPERARAFLRAQRPLRVSEVPAS
jgi:hypothetical protein